MNYLQLTQETVVESGARVTRPSTVVDLTGINDLFAKWVSDSWRDLQLERYGSAFRVSRNLEFDLVADTYEYGVNSNLESVNLRTFTCHLDDENETPLCWQPYDTYRLTIDRVERQSGKPQHFTITPDNNFVFWPNPDEAYTVRYDGIRVVEIFDRTDADGVGTSDALEPTGLDDAYHAAIVWLSVIKYAMHFEDGSALAKGQMNWKPFKKYFEERFMPLVTVNTSSLYAISR